WPVAEVRAVSPAKCIGITMDTYADPSVGPPGTIAFRPLEVADVTLTAATLRTDTVHTASTQARGYLIPLTEACRPGRQILWIEAKYTGGSGHSALPEFLPRIHLVVVDPISSAVTWIDDPVVAAPADTTELEAGVTMTIDYDPPLPVVGGEHFLFFFAEGGTNAEVEGVLGAIRIALTR